MDIAIQLKKRNLEMIDHRQHVLGGTYILDKNLHICLYLYRLTTLLIDLRMSFVNTILVNSFKLYQQQRYCKMLYMQK